MSRGLNQGSIAGLLTGYAQGDTTPCAELERCLERAASPDACGSFIRITAERARAEATASTMRWRCHRPRSHLDGVPLGWKDMFDLQGQVTTGGSLVIDQSVARRDAALVRQAQDAGAVCVGKTNLSELAFSGLGLNPHYGTPVNPHSPAGDPRVCGGSSSGSAAAVARGLCAAAIGTDTSGSVRVPAAFTGLRGYRASQRRYSMRGVKVLSSSLDSLGILAHSAADIAIVDTVLRGSPRREKLPDLRSARFLVVEDLLNSSQAAQRDACLAFARRLKNLGLEVSVAACTVLEKTQALFGQHGTIVAAEAFQRHAARLDEPQRSRLDPLVRQRLEQARQFSAFDYISLMRARPQLRDQLATSHGETVFVFPTTPIVAPSVRDASNPERYTDLNAAALSHTMVGSFLDMPGLAMPFGRDADAMPTSVLLSVVSGRDDWLLDLAVMLDPLIVEAGSTCPVMSR